ncbi:MAG: CCA tRNA nucleotidyltransferase, partial [Planctomycetes bacterium]|nr:CCA tRNA nucleotidyltransferase [Planctomycetota bacterium]
REARELARVLRRAGHQAVFAGGAVRDRLLGVRGGDVDIATSARPDQVQALFPRTVRVGEAFGVVKVLHGRGQYDVATFRRDVGIGDGRHPATVEPSTLEEDVQRRDFSINGLVEDPFSGALTDLVGGRDDLRAGIVRAIGDPALRFREDALRLLRGVRFAARLGFRIEAGTLAAMRAEAQRLRLVSGERVREELARMLVHASRRRAIELLDETGLLGLVLPELPPMKGCEQPPDFHPEGDVWVHTLLALDKLPPRPSFELALGMLLHDIGKPPTFVRAADRIRFDGHVELGADMARAVCGRLRMSNASTERVVALVRDHLLFKDVPQMRPARLRRLMAEPHWPELLQLYKADVAACHGQFSALPAIAAMRRKLAQEALVPPPLLRGEDVLALGVEPGKRVGDLLREAADRQLDGELADREAALAWLRGRVAAG